MNQLGARHTCGLGGAIELFQLGRRIARGYGELFHGRTTNQTVNYGGSFQRRNRASHQTHANLIRSACVSGMFDDDGNALPVIHVFDKYTRGKVPPR